MQALLYNNRDFAGTIHYEIFARIHDLNIVTNNIVTKIEGTLLDCDVFITIMNNKIHYSLDNKGIILTVKKVNLYNCAKAIFAYIREGIFPVGLNIHYNNLAKLLFCHTKHSNILLKLPNDDKFKALIVSKEMSVYPEIDFNSIEILAANYGAEQFPNLRVLITDREFKSDKYKVYNVTNHHDVNYLIYKLLSN